MSDPQPVFMKNGRAATRGVCAVCGTGLYKIGATPAHASLSAPAPEKRPQKSPSARPAPRTSTDEPAPGRPLTAEVEAYCVKCKAKRAIRDGVALFMANGRPAASGVCPACGTRLFKLGATPDHEGLEPPAAERSRVRKGAATPASSKTSTGNKKKTSLPVKRAQNATPVGRADGSNLVIVESPAKARTVGRFLGKGYQVTASVGHVRDLLRSKLSVDVEHDFEPTYRVPNEKRELVKGLKKAASVARRIYLATDPDREGEAIAWHLLEAAEIDPERTQRVVFHEITKSAIAEAFSHSRDIDMHLVDAQQARRILDRLVGYQISPLLWERVKGRLSAGRVQSVALRLIVEREREIVAFQPVEYWSIDAELAQISSRRDRSRSSFLARLIRVNGAEPDLKDHDTARALLAALEHSDYRVAAVKRGERRRRPNPPFTTSTLQQDASNKLGMTASRTMRIAQQLYEGIDTAEGGSVGLITYMRTDSVNVAREAQEEARKLIEREFGADFVPPEPNVFRARAKNAQEAHEAIRPTSVSRTPQAMRSYLTRDQHRIYELVWQRFMASQMAAAVYDTLTIDVEAGPNGGVDGPYQFRASGSKMRFPGFLMVYAGGAAGPTNGPNNGDVGAEAGGGNGVGATEGASGANGQSGEEAGDQASLPELSTGEPLDLVALHPEQHFTQPPPRFSEASLVKTLEENGIGRPSTYAAIISTILDRGYTERSDKRLVPTELGYTVNDLLVKHFDSVFSVGFTAGMEESLDRIASGQEELTPVLRTFYDFFEPQLKEAERTMEKVAIEPEKTGEKCPLCGGDLVFKTGRFGRFIGCEKYPECKFTKPITTSIGVLCPLDGGELVERRTKRGRIFYGCANYPQCDFTSWKRPLAVRCPSCGGLMVVATKEWAQCTKCEHRVPLQSIESAQGPGR